MINETKLREYYEEYCLIEKIIVEKAIERDKLYNSFKESKAGKLYLSLSEEQQKAFEYIYSDTIYQQYLLYKKQVDEFEEVRNKLLLNISQDKEVFPFKQEDESYGKAKKEIIELLNISNDLKEFIQMITLRINNTNNTQKNNKNRL